MRTGREYLDRLRDGRAVFADGQRIPDPTEHAGLLGIAESVAGLYDFAADPANEMGAWSADAGCHANKAFLIPRSLDDLVERRAAIEKWAELSLGFIGRGPDHVASFLAGFASAPELYDRPSHRFGQHLLDFYRQVAREDAFVSYVIVPPQGAHLGAGETPIQVAAVDETADGIVVRGAQVLGTCSSVSDHLFVSCIKPLAASEARHAVSFAVPIATEGLRLYLRRPYGSAPASEFDYPLSARFDETDALVVFDDVFVPWERVFVYRDVEWSNRHFQVTGAHALGNTQAQIRLVTKLKALVGLAYLIAQANGSDGLPQVQERLGELAAIAAVYEGMVLGAEASAAPDERGVFVPSRRLLYSAMGLQPELYPRALAIIRDLAGQGLLLVPASELDLRNQVAYDDFARYAPAVGMDCESRVKLFKLAWDAVGSEFGGRHHQYEMFYAGAPFVQRLNAYRNYGFAESSELVQRFLEQYGLDVVAPVGG